MKAKSWKKFAKKNEQSESQAEKDVFSNVFNDTGANTSNSPSFENILEKNSTLKGLMSERDALEKQMAQLTGQSVGSSGRDSLGEIPTHETRRKRDQEWQNQRDKALRALHEKQALLERESAGYKDVFKDRFNSNAMPVDPSISDNRFAKRLQKENDRFQQSDIKSGIDNWSNKLDKAKQKVDQLMQKKNKIEEAADQKLMKGKSNPVEKKWEELREKKLGLSAIRSKYEEKVGRILKVDTGSLEELAKRLQKAKEKSQQKKKEEKEEERKREKKREERKQKKKERF